MRHGRVEETTSPQGLDLCSLGTPEPGISWFQWVEGGKWTIRGPGGAVGKYEKCQTSFQGFICSQQGAESKGRVIV